MNYKGIKILDKIIIVERTENTDRVIRYSYWSERPTINQGYIVDPGNTKMMETAKTWASWDEYLIEYKYNASPEEREEYEKSYRKHEGVEHLYENGNFEIILEEAADDSTQSGKLSFWNCRIIAPDGKEYLIGINAELLLKLLKKNTFINGKCQSKVWLGRVWGNQVGVFTENMEDFEQAKKDEVARNRKRTSNYQVGDIVETLTERAIYVGEFYQYADVYIDRNSSYYHPDRTFVCKEKPVKVYGYVQLAQGETMPESWRRIEFKTNKVSRFIAGQNDEAAKKYRSLVDNFKKEFTKIRVSEVSAEEALAKNISHQAQRPFSYILENLISRTDPIINTAEIKSDLQAALAYIKEENHGEETRFEGYKVEDMEPRRYDYVTDIDSFVMYEDFYK